MPLDRQSYGHSYLTSYGWTGKGTGLRHGAIEKPLAVPPKKNLGGLGNDRDEAFPFWDHLFTAASKAITIKVTSDDSDDEDDTPKVTTVNFNRTTTGIISNRRPVAATPASVPVSGTATPDTDTPYAARLSLIATAKREAARRGLYSRFFRGPVLGPNHDPHTSTAPSPSPSPPESEPPSHADSTVEVPLRSRKEKVKNKKNNEEDRLELKRLKRERKKAKAARKTEKANAKPEPQEEKGEGQLKVRRKRKMETKPSDEGEQCTSTPPKKKRKRDRERLVSDESNLDGTRVTHKESKEPVRQCSQDRTERKERKSLDDGPPSNEEKSLDTLDTRKKKGKRKKVASS